MEEQHLTNMIQEIVKMFYDVLKDWTRTNQDQLMSLHLFSVFTDQGDIREVIILPQVSNDFWCT